ncbi:hypothetical protein MADA3029_1220031 [Vibrio nigripulchritudo MADA3029]|nr:hypothetical protein VIBNIMADA3020_800031 [Vibrio nigripulchritudo MADA3020]CCN55315.1 hypothetical protein VIBNIMADA3021_740034 [Vibrio nigripulchritudo MADA3021]CCN57978.1 hypothetical protein MADA3029_1220031 [Vibrio nigripulchritudo MADA3029]
MNSLGKSSVPHPHVILKRWKPISEWENATLLLQYPHALAEVSDKYHSKLSWWHFVSAHGLMFWVYIL